MLAALVPAKLEIRTDGSSARTIYGQFPLRSEAKVYRRGEPVSKWVVPDGFRHAGETGGPHNTYLLLGHSFEQPLADINGGSLSITRRADRIELVATVPDIRPSWMDDAVRVLDAGVIRGLLPGSYLPRGGSQVTQGRRTISRAIVHEYSLVANPAYREATAETRSFSPMIEDALDHILWL